MGEHSDGIVYLDGSWIDDTQACLSILDCGVQPGLTVMDTAPVTEGRIFRLDAHLDRFYASLKVVRFDNFPHSVDALEAIVIDAVRRSGLRHALVTIMATRGVRTAGRWTTIAELIPTLIVHCRPAPMVAHALKETGCRACVSSLRSTPSQCLPPELKHFNRLPNYLAELEAADQGVDLALLLDLDGRVTEGPTFNVFAVRNGTLVTPASGMLHGVTRDTVMTIAAHHGIPVIEGSLTPYDLYTADEVFATSVSRGALGIVEIDHRRIGTGRPGPITRRLDETYWSWRVNSDYVVTVFDRNEAATA